MIDIDSNYVLFEFLLYNSRSSNLGRDFFKVGGADYLFTWKNTEKSVMIYDEG